MITILLITDSRGKGVRSLIKDRPKLTSSGNIINWDIQVLPGATLESIQKRIERGNRRGTWDHIIVLAGICSFTSKSTGRGKKLIEYKIRKLEENCRTIEELLEKRNIHLCTITPAVLQKASDRQDQQVEIEQAHLEEDIADTNQFIIQKNIERDTPTIDLAKLSTIRSIKKQGNKKKRIIKLDKKDLEDGVHPSATLQESWTNRIIDFVEKITQDVIPPSDDYSTEEEPETWNFKRQGRT